nr:MAG TPA: hypothetical protein [Caudoviricetes sp.]
MFRSPFIIPFSITFQIKKLNTKILNLYRIIPIV